jgi:hypothetical protein
MQPGREHPWNIRRVSHRHLHDQRNLLDLQALTLAWTTPPAAPETEPDATDPLAPRSPATPADPLALEAALEDDTWPDDVLQRQEAEVHRAQLHALSARLADGDRLAELSYHAGQEAASRRWMQADPAEGSIAPADKRALLLALYHSPLGGRLGREAFLVRRALITEVSVELLQCPHRLAAAKPRGGENPALVDELCRQQFSWLKGYFNFLNPALVPVLSRPRGRCVVSW